MKKKHRLLALFLSLVMVFTVIAVPGAVLAQPNAVGLNNTKSSSWVSTIFDLAGKACITKGVNWGLDGMMAALFGAETSEEQKMLEELQQQMATVLANQDKILDELNHLASLVEVQSYLKIINDYTKALNQCQPFFTCYDTLNALDVQYADNPEALKSQRLRALTEGLNISNMVSINTDADQHFLNLYNAFVGPFQYTVNGEIKSGDLLDIYREIKRYQYCWENEAWDEMEAFFDYTAVGYGLVSTIEMGSVQARIEQCNLHNQGKAVTDPDYWSTASLETWLYNASGTAANQDLESRIQAGGTVYKNHPVVRQNNYRHYWKPGNELIFYTTIRNLGDHPVDEPLVGKGGTSADSMFRKAQGLYMKGSGKNATLNDDFWGQFYRSETDPEATLASTREINQLLAGCNHSKTLKEILDAGQFTYTTGDSSALLGLVLKKDDDQNPFVVEESHTEQWQEYIGTLRTDKIRPYVRYAAMDQKTELKKGAASKYGTYYYFHTDDSPVRWNIQDNYTKGSLGQLFVCEGACLHEHLLVDDSSAVEATCSAAGKTADIICQDCGAVFPGETIAKKPHISDGWQHDNNQHYKICSVCGEKYDVSSHTFSGSGFITGIFVCSTCGYVYFSPTPVSSSTEPEQETPSSVQSSQRPILETGWPHYPWLWHHHWIPFVPENPDSLTNPFTRDHFFNRKR